MSLDAISARSINFKVLRYPRQNADDLMIAVSVMAFRMNEIMIKNQLEKFQDGVNKIAELSRMKNKFNAQMASMSDEQKKAGLYINEAGDLVSVLDSAITQDILPPDPKKMESEPVNGTWHTKLTSSDGEVLDISIDYQMGYENGSYYFQITGLKIGDYNGSSSADNWKYEYGLTLGSESFDKRYADGTTSLNSIITEELNKVIDNLQKENTKLSISDPNNRSQICNDLSNEYFDNIVSGLTANMFSTMKKNGYENDSVDAIFTQNGGESSLSEIPKAINSTTLDIKVAGLTFEMTITWKVDQESGDLIFDVYLNLPGGSQDWLTNAAGGYIVNGADLLHIVKGYKVTPNEGEDENSFFARAFKTLSGMISETLNDRATNSIGSNNENTAFWEALLGEKIYFHDKGGVGKDATVADSPDDDIKELLGDAPLYNGVTGEQIEENNKGAGIREEFQNEHRATFGDAQFQHASQLIGAAIYDQLVTQGKTTIGKIAPDFDYSLLGKADSANATDGTSALIRGFYEPNTLETKSYSANPAAFLEDIMGEEIYKNGNAYTDKYWNDTILPQITDSITAISSANEVVMSKLKRLIETANSYLQMIITDLQKQFQALNAVANNM